MLMRFALLGALLGASVQGVVPMQAQAQTTPQKKYASPTVVLNQEALTQLPVPFEKDGTLYLPVNLFPHLGMRIETDESQRQVKVLSGKSIYTLKAGTKFVAWHQSGLQLPKVPIWQSGTLYVPSSFFVQLGVPIGFSRFSNEVKLNRDLNQFKALNTSSSEVYSRVVLELEQSPVYKVYESKTAVTIDFYGTEVKEPGQFVRATNDVLLKSIEIQNLGLGVTRLILKKNYPAPHKLFWLESPNRLMVDFIKIFQEEQSQTLDSGVRYTQTYQGYPHGPVTYHLVKVDTPSDYQLLPEVALRNTQFTLQPPSALARANQALLAINGSYFNYKGLPLGLVLKDKEFFSSPIYNRTFLGVTDQNTLFIDNTSRSLAVEFPGQKHTQTFNAVNLPRHNDQMVLYTPHYGSSTKTSASDNALELEVMLDGTVQEVHTHNAPIPDNGFVISAHGQGARWLKSHAYPGMRALIFSQLYSEWENIRHIMSGGPRLLKGGQPFVTSKEERFQPDIASGRAPRTAFGIGPRGEWYFLVVDGRQHLSRGVTLWELAKLLKEKGAVEALNFDGGGSSAMVIRGQVVNKPSDGRERPVSNALLLKKGAFSQVRR